MTFQLLAQNDFWMDNALENFCNLLKSADVDVRIQPDGIVINIKDEQGTLVQLQRQIKSKHDSVIFYQIKDKKGLPHNIRLDYILLPYGKKAAGRNVLKENFFDGREMRKFLRAAITPRRGSRVCILCNKSFERSVGKLKQGVYPLATKNRALSGIRKKSDYIDELCPTCFVIGVLEWTDEGLPYRCSLQDDSFVLFPNFSSFIDLTQFKKISRQILVERDLTSNVKVHTFEGSDAYAAGVYSALLLFIEQVIIRLTTQKTEETIFRDVPARAICRDWICLKVPSGIVKDVKCSSIKVDHIVMGIASVVTKLLQHRKKELEIGIYSEILAKVDIKPQPGNRISWDRLQGLKLQFRELMAQGFLENDLHTFSSAFLPRRGVYKVMKGISGLELLLEEWCFKHIGLSERDIESIKKSADIFAEVCTKNIGLLYQMDRAQTAQDFVFTLKEGAKKLVGIADEVTKPSTGLTPVSLEEFFRLLASREEHWKLLRDALVLYTSLAYSSKKVSQGA